MGTLVLAMLLAAAVPLAAQPGQPQGQDPARRVGSEADGKTVVSVNIVLLDQNGRPRSDDETAGLIQNIIPLLTVEPDREFRLEDASSDLLVLFKQLFVIGGGEREGGGVYYEEVPGGIRVEYRLIDSGAFDRVEFRGLDHFSEIQVRTLLGLDARQRLSGFAAKKYELQLIDKYRRDGYYHVEIRSGQDPEDPDVLLFEVDEGPKVTVRRVRFVGNAAFPEWAPFNLYPALISGSKMKSKPGGLFRGAPYSDDLVQEDIDLLRYYYRERGFKDATVELASRDWIGDSRVDLTFSIHEGPRYRIGSVELEQIPASGVPAPLYAREDLLEELRVEKGEVYSTQKIRQDEDRIERYYGIRGHLPAGRYGREIDEPVEVLPTLETYDVENALVHLRYQVREGTPKRIRAIQIEGNTFTKDRVIRRQIYLYPGELANLQEAERSVQLLDGLQYFQDPETLRNVRLRFERVPSAIDVLGEGSQDQVDMVIDLQDGSTGQFLWGAGISSNAGVQARFVLNKQNFDAGRLPSSGDPLTVFEEIRTNEAFHGAGQDLELLIAPGTEVSQFRISFREPDIFRSHQDTWGLRADLSRLLRRLDSFDRDSLAIELGLSRNFSPNLSAGVSFREEYATIDGLRFDAPEVVAEAEGTNAIRSTTFNVLLRDLDFLLAPTEGYQVRSYLQLAVFGGDANFFKVGASGEYHLPLIRDSRDRAHVLFTSLNFDFGQGILGSDDLFITERFYMGGFNLRGFDQRQAGPTQFFQPTAGEVRLLARAEYRFPLVSTRPEGAVRDFELLRGVLFADYGQLGLAIDDPTFNEPRLSVGFGLRIIVPQFRIPLALDFGFPVIYEETDERRTFQFSLSSGN